MNHQFYYSYYRKRSFRKNVYFCISIGDLKKPSFNAAKKIKGSLALILFWKYETKVGLIHINRLLVKGVLNFVKFKTLIINLFEIA